MIQDGNNTPFRIMFDNTDQGTEDIYNPLNDLQKGNVQANQYQRTALRTLGTGYKEEKDKLINGVMGLNGEAGEVIDIVKKHLFQGHDFDRNHFIEELGDVVAYLALCTNAVDTTLGEVMLKNIEKLNKRYPNGFSPEKSRHREVENNEKIKI